MSLETQNDKSGQVVAAASHEGLNRPARATIRLGWRTTRFEAEAEITPLGLLAIGGMVGAILLAVAPIVTAVGRARRHR